QTDAPVLPARRAGGLGGRAPESAGAHLTVVEGPVVPHAVARGSRRENALDDHPRRGRALLTVKVGELLETLDGGLALELVAGVTGLDRPIDVPRVQQPGLALAGYLPQLHPDRMQVLGNSEVGYLETLDPILARERIEAIVQSGVACFVVTN